MAKNESNSKDNTLSIIALVALVAVVGMVVAFAISTKGSTGTQTRTMMSAPVKTTETATNSAGQMVGGKISCDGEQCENGQQCIWGDDRYHCG